MSTALMKYHPRAGYTYMPGARLRMPSPRGGYLVRANSAGFRSEREFQRQPVSGTFRMMLFGDSQTAGDGVNNDVRYSDVLEKAVPGLEVYNYAVTGQGPDQQLLLFEEQTETHRDLVVIGLYVENIRRIRSQLHKSKQLDGLVVYRPKPFFELQNGELVLRNVPVPKEPFTDETLPEDLLPQVYAHGEADRVMYKVKSFLRAAPFAAPLARAIKSTARRLDRFRLLPEYDKPDDPSWLVLSGILKRYLQISRAPVLIFLIPHYHFLSREGEASSYQARFREFAGATGCCVVDALPDLLQCSPQERSELWSDANGHLSAAGHARIAALLGPHVRQFASKNP